MLDMPITPSMVEHSRGFLARPMVRAAIAEQIKAVSSNHDLTWRRVADEYKALAFSDVSNYNLARMLVHDPLTGQWTINYDGLTRAHRRAIQKIKLTLPANPHAPMKVEFELYDKQRALDKLAAHMDALSPGNPYWKDTETKSRTARQMRQIDTHVDDETAAELYARRLKETDE